jgi:hypothetical protein
MKYEYKNLKSNKNIKLNIEKNLLLYMDQMEQEKQHFQDQ